MRQFAALFALAMLCLVGCRQQSDEEKRAAQQKIFEKVAAPPVVDPWPADPAHSNKDVYVVKAIQEIDKTGIKSVVVERVRDQYLISALTGKECKIGEQIKLVTVRRFKNSGLEYASTIMIE